VLVGEGDAVCVELELGKNKDCEGEAVLVLVNV